jgi:hypothetical protein
VLDGQCGPGEQRAHQRDRTSDSQSLHHRVSPTQ